MQEIILCYQWYHMVYNEVEHLGITVVKSFVQRV